MLTALCTLLLPTLGGKPCFRDTPWANDEGGNTPETGIPQDVPCVTAPGS